MLPETVKQKQRKLNLLGVFLSWSRRAGGRAQQKYVIQVALRRLGGFKGSKKIFGDSSYLSPIKEF